MSEALTPTSERARRAKAFRAAAHATLDAGHRDAAMFLLEEAARLAGASEGAEAPAADSAGLPARWSRARFRELDRDVDGVLEGPRTLAQRVLFAARWLAWLSALGVLCFGLVYAIQELRYVPDLTVGGRLGAPTETVCPGDAAMTGLSVRDSGIVTGLQIHCQGGHVGPWVEATEGDRTTDLSCPDTLIAIGAHGRAGAAIDGVGLVCGTLDASTVRNSPVGGGGGGGGFTLVCDPGEALYGLRVRRGTQIVDTVTLLCR